MWYDRKLHRGVASACDLVLVLKPGQTKVQENKDGANARLKRARAEAEALARGETLPPPDIEDSGDGEEDKSNNG